MLICLKCDQLTEPTSFRAEGALVFAVCSQCHGEVQIGELSQGPRPRRSGPLAAVPPPPPLPEPDAAATVTLSLEDLPVDPFAPPPSYCPKCIAPLGGGAMTMCPQCGLDARFKDQGAFAPPFLLASPWKELVERWERPDAHAALIRQAERLGLAADLGRLYLIYLSQRPQDRLAEQGLEEVSRLAAAAVAERPAQVVSSRARTIAFWVGLAVAGWGVVALLAPLMR
ncbi:MAG TPA: hypothetical protein VFA20_03425 [Myxococcaceae bacterium]|nr:hypothetical protein [Myxococcaceae bacterium]